MGLSLIALLMLSGSLSLRTIGRTATEWMVLCFVSAIRFCDFSYMCICRVQSNNPFDLSEAESELNFGYHQEYSSMKLGFYLFAEYVNMFISSAVMATIFWGGYDIPFVNDASFGLNHGQNLLAILQGFEFVYQSSDLYILFLCG